MGKVCICGASALQIDYAKKTVSVAGQTFKEGDFLSIDGTAGTVYAGQLATAPSEIITGTLHGDKAAQKTEKFKAFNQLMKWCGDAARLEVRCNADNPEQTENALAFGAVGIGLTRTEHMFFEGNRIDSMREMILADNLEDRKAALAKLLPYQREDFTGIFKALRGFPATIACSIRRCTSFCHTRKSSRWISRRRSASSRVHPATRRAAPRIQPDARPSRLPPRDRLPGDHRNAGARDL
jgi:pyruvate,orthophosphate dikinase